MLQWQPNQVIILTPKGTVIVARRLYELLEERVPPEDAGLLRDLDWWRQMSDLVSGIQIVCMSTREQR